MPSSLPQRSQFVSLVTLLNISPTRINDHSSLSLLRPNYVAWRTSVKRITTDLSHELRFLSNFQSPRRERGECNSGVQWKSTHPWPQRYRVGTTFPPPRMVSLTIWRRLKRPQAIRNPYPTKCWMSIATRACPVLEKNRETHDEAYPSKSMVLQTTPLQDHTMAAAPVISVLMGKLTFNSNLSKHVASNQSRDCRTIRNCKTPSA